MTIKDIAKLAHVSPTTVSLIINKKDKNITEETRQRVLGVIKANNYVPNLVARSMITKKSNIIGLILPDITNSFFAEMARRAEDIAKELGYSLILCNTDDKPEEERNYISLLKEKHVDGLVLITSDYSEDKENEQLDSENIPVVFLDRYVESGGYGSVSFDNFRAGYLGADYLLSHGHRKIGCITGNIETPNVRDRIKGCLNAFKAYGIKADSIPFYQGDYRIESGEVGAKELLKKYNLTAVFALNDMMAIC